MAVDSVLGWVEQYGYVGIFSLLMLGILGLPIPDEGLMAFAGYLVFKGDLQLVPTIGASFLGSICGVTLSYVVGRTAGNRLIKRYGRFIGVTTDKITQVHDWIDRVGRWGLAFGYFLPGIRHLTAFVAGMSKTQLSVFARFTYAGGLIWSATFILTGYSLGKEWHAVADTIRPALLSTSVLLVASLLVYFLWQRRKQNHQ